jgi:hypothetical protein
MMSDVPDTPDDKSPYEQRGKRGNPAYAQVAGMIPLELRRRFKAKVALRGEDMSRVLEALIREYVEGE